MIPRFGRNGRRTVFIGIVTASFSCTTLNARAEPAHDPHAHNDPKLGSTDSHKSDAAKTENGRTQAQLDIDKYCVNIASATAQAAHTVRVQQLRELEKQIEQRIGELDAKRAEVQRLIETSEAIFAKVDQSLIDLYSKMKPDTAANQIAKLDDDVAVALLVRVKTKELSAIMDEMEPERAAALAKKLSQKIRGHMDGKQK